MYEQVFELHAELLKALAHPRRLEIVNLLRDQELCVSEMYEMLDLPQANISQHLMILRDAGVVTAQRQGKQMCYRLRDAKITKAVDLLSGVLAQLHQGTEIADHLTLKMNKLVPVVHDVVCGMRVSPQTAGGSYNYNDKEYFFCASGCLKKFEHNPEAYAT